MKNNILITIDGGTTNTRAVLWKNNEVIAKTSRQIGVQNTATSSDNQLLKEAVKNCIEEVMETASVDYTKITAIIASGMLTSNVGLIEIPHLTAPVNVQALASHIKCVMLEDICPLPIYFIPGIKNNVSNITMDSFEQMDMMRGEEVEVCAILKEYPIHKPTLLILPGSHNKFIPVDKNGSIMGCLTTISGELISAITYHTILAKSVGQKFVTPEKYDKNMVLHGYETASLSGLGRACFSGRIFGSFVENDEIKIANFLLGAILQGDIAAFQHSSFISINDETDIIIAGKNPLRQALADILHHINPQYHITEYEPESGQSLSSIGAKYLYDLFQ